MGLRPGSCEELSAGLARATREQTKVVIRGGGSYGGDCVAPDGATLLGATLLDTTGLVGELRHDPADLVVTADAGMRWRELSMRLRERGQRVPLDPPVNAQSTLGGVLASGRSGPLTLTRGRARDWVLGALVARGDGTLVRSGGRVVKNVTGYDLHKAQLGAQGRLGVLARVDLKLEPAPEETVWLAVACGSRTAALEAVRSLLQVDSGLASAVLVPGEWGQEQLRSIFAIDGGRAILPTGALSYRLLFLGLEGRSESITKLVDAARRQLRRLGFGGTPAVIDPALAPTVPELWGDLRLDASTALVVRVQAPAASLIRVLDEAEANGWLEGATELLVPGAEMGWLSYTAAAAAVSPLATLRTALQQAGGGLIIERSTVPFPLDPWGLDPTQREVHLRLMRAFDPAGILGPELFASAENAESVS